MTRVAHTECESRPAEGYGLKELNDMEMTETLHIESRHIRPFEWGSYLAFIDTLRQYRRCTFISRGNLDKHWNESF